jgi:tetratricopeptide (TPR) repeat protein
MRRCAGNLVLSLAIAAVSLPLACAAAHEPTLARVVELFELQDYGEARRVLEELPEELRRTGHGYYYAGRLDLIHGDHEVAVGSFEKAVAVDNEKCEYHHWLGTALMRRAIYRSFTGRMGDAMRAVEEFRKAITCDPRDLPPRMTLFQMMARSPGMGGATKEDLLQQASAIAEIDSIMGRVARGTFFQVVEKDMARADAELSRAFKLAPENRAAAIAHADHLWESDQRDEALLVLRSFVERIPDDKSARFNLATRIIQSQADLNGAKAVLNECLSLQSDTGMPSETMVRWCLGLAHRLIGEEEEAQREWSVVYEMDGSFDRVLEQNPQLSELKALIGE